jgi:hypothetical protein
MLCKVIIATQCAMMWHVRLRQCAGTLGVHDSRQRLEPPAAWVLRALQVHDGSVFAASTQQQGLAQPSQLFIAMSG